MLSQQIQGNIHRFTIYCGKKTKKKNKDKLRISSFMGPLKLDEPRTQLEFTQMHRAYN